MVISDTSLHLMTGESPESLVLEVNKSLKNGDVLFAIVPYGNRHVAYIIKPKEIKPAVQEKKKQTKKGV